MTSTSTVTRISIELAGSADAGTLARISERAFHSDVECGAPDTGGPPGYDSPQWQTDIMHSANYFKLCIDGETVGGAIVYDQGDGHIYLGRIFLDPICHRRGKGTEFMKLLLEQFPGAHKWTLETPTWNNRTRNFYLALGFRIVEETAEDLFFEKVMS